MYYSTEMTKESRVQYKFYIPADLKKELEHKAIENNRSLSGEIIQRLERTLASDVLNKNIPDNVVEKHDIKDERQKEILRKKLEEALIGTGITEVLAEYVFQERNKEKSHD